jgi:hypothetical protein
VYKPIVGVEAEKLRAGLEAVKGRCTEEEQESNNYDLGKVLHPVPIPFHWQDGGKFKREELPEDKQDELIEEARLEMAPRSGLFGTRVKLVADRDVLERPDVDIVANHFVAFEITYEGPENKRQDFWIGQVTRVHEAEAELTLHTWHSPKQFGNYRPWTRSQKFMTIRREDVLIARQTLFKPPKGKNGKTGLIEGCYKTVILQTLAARKADREAGSAASEQRYQQSGIQPDEPNIDGLFDNDEENELTLLTGRKTLRGVMVGKAAKAAT